MSSDARGLRTKTRPCIVYTRECARIAPARARRLETHGTHPSLARQRRQPLCRGAEPLPRAGARLSRGHAQPRARRRGRGAAHRGRGGRDHPRLATRICWVCRRCRRTTTSPSRYAELGREAGIPVIIGGYHITELPQQSDPGHERRRPRRGRVRAGRAGRALPRARRAAAGEARRDRGAGLLGRRRAGPDHAPRGGGQEGEGPRRAAHGGPFHDAGPAALEHADLARLSVQLHLLRLDPVLAQHPLLLTRVHDGGDQTPPRHLRRQVHHLPRRSLHRQHQATRRAARVGDARGAAEAGLPFLVRLVGDPDHRRHRADAQGDELRLDLHGARVGQPGGPDPAQGQGLQGRHQRATRSTRCTGTGSTRTPRSSSASRRRPSSR